MIARVTATHHRILFRGAFHVGAGQVIEQHIELGSEQLAVALLEMLFQFRLVRQNPVQTPVQALSLILPSSISSRSSSAVDGYQRSSIANSLPGAHSRLMAIHAAT